MSDIGRWIVWGLMPSLIAGLVINAAVPFEAIDSTVFSTIINDPILRIIGLTIVLVAPIYFGLNYIISLTKAVVERRQEIQSSNSTGASVVPSRTSSPVWHGVIRHFGADWFVTIGSNRGGNPYAYVDRGPCCPECQTEMLHRNKPKFVVLKHRMWLCPECNNSVARPEDLLFEEKEGVKNVAEKHITVALEQDDPETYIESVEGLNTGKWSRRVR